MDATIPPRAMSGASDVNVSSKQILLDANISNPCGSKAIREYHTNTVPGASTARVETSKADKYADTYVPATSNLIVAAFETFGRFGKQSRDFLEQMVEHWASRLVVADDLKAARSGQQMRYIKQQLSVALQKGLSRRELRFVQAMRRKKMPNVIMIESLWDMTEDTIGVRYGQYADMKQAAVVVGATVDGGRGG
jgi:hypothetical protein